MRHRRLSIALGSSLLAAALLGGPLVEALSPATAARLVALARAEDFGIEKEIQRARRDAEDQAAQLQEKSSQLDDRTREFVQKAGDLTIAGYRYAVILFVAVPLALFLLKLLWNLTIGPMRQRKVARTFVAQMNQSPDDFIARAKDALARKEYAEAADLFSRGNDELRAAQAYEKGGDLLQAASFYMRAKAFKDAARIFASSRRHKDAARNYEEAKAFAAAAEQYELAGDRMSAAACFEKAGDAKKAADMYEADGNLHKAGTLYEKIGDQAGMARVSGQLGGAGAPGPFGARRGPNIAPQNAAGILQKAEAFRENPSAVASSGDLVKAIRLYLEKNEIDPATEVYTRCSTDIADKVLDSVPYDSELTQRYQQLFLKARDFKSAATVFERAGRYHEAAELFAKAGEFYYAGEMFEMAGILDKAANHYEKGGASMKAAPILEQLGQHKRAGFNWEKAGQFFNAAEAYEKDGDTVKALAAFQKVPQGDAGYLEAQERIAGLKKALGAAAVAAPPPAAVARPAAAAAPPPGLRPLAAPAAAQPPFGMQPTLQGAARPPLGGGHGGPPLASAPGGLAARAGSGAFPPVAPAALRGPALTPASLPAVAPPVPVAPMPLPEAAILDAAIVDATVEPASGQTLTALPVYDDGGEAADVALIAEIADDDEDAVLVTPLDGFEWLKNSSYFSELTLDELRRLYDACVSERFAPGSVVVDEGAVGRALFILKRGGVRVTKGRGAERRPLARLGPGDHFGEIALITDLPATASVEVVEPSEALVLSRDAFERFLAGDAIAAVKMYRAFATALAHRLKRANEDVAIATAAAPPDATAPHVIPNHL